MDLRPVARLEWEQILRRARLTGIIAGTGRKGRKGLPTHGGVSPALFMAVALDLASYGDFAGGNIWPGDAAIAVDLECSIGTVKTVRSKLAELGLIQRVGPRRRGRGGEEYRLTLPEDLLDRLDILTPAAHRRAAQCERDKSRGKPKPPLGGSTGYPEMSADPDDDEVSGGPLDTPDDEDADGSGGPLDPRSESSGGPLDPRSGGPLDRITYPGPFQENHHANSDEDLDTAVTGPREGRPSEDRISPDEVDPTARWIGRAAAPEPTTPPRDKCEHRLTAAWRPDGEYACPVCRRQSWSSSATAMHPIVPTSREATDGPLADVIPLTRRSAS